MYKFNAETRIEIEMLNLIELTGYEFNEFFKLTQENGIDWAIDQVTTHCIPLDDQYDHESLPIFIDAMLTDNEYGIEHALDLLKLELLGDWCL